MDVPTRPDSQLNIARARGLMLQALEALDEIGVATDAAAHWIWPSTGSARPLARLKRTLAAARYALPTPRQIDDMTTRLG